MAHSTTLRASVTADSATTEGGPATVLVDGADTPVTANGLQGYAPTPGDRLLVQQVGRAVEVLQFISTGTVPGIPDGSITDAKIALLGLNPAKGILDMRPGAFTCFIHDWRFRDSTYNASRFGTSTSITLETIAEELSFPYGDTGATMGNVGDAPPSEYVAGPTCSLGNVVNDTDNFLNNNVVPVTVTGALNPGDTVVSTTFDAAAASKVGMTAWTGIATLYLNLNATTQNAALVADGGVLATTRLEWLDADGTTVIYSVDSTTPSFEYYGHYDYAVMEANNFSTAAIGSLVPTYIRLSVIWQGTALTADAAGTNSFILPGFSLWYIGGPSYQPGTPYVKMDHNLPVEEVTLLSGLPVTPGDVYALHCRRNPWSESIPYTGSDTSPEGGGEIIVRLHLSDGTTSDHGPGPGTGSFEAAGWQHQSSTITIPENAVSLDVVFHQDPADPLDPWTPFGSQVNSVDHFILPRLTIAGWGGSFTVGPGAHIHDGGLVWYDSDGVQAINLDATNNSGGAALSGYVAIGPRNPGTESFVDRDSSLGIWTGGNDAGSVDTTQPDRLGIKLDPYHNTVKEFNAPFTLGGGSDGDANAAMVMMADRGTTGTDATKGFVGVVKGQYPNPGATAVETGFIFDSDTNTITPVGTLGASGRIPGEVIMWPGPVLPSSSWLKCDGSSVEGFTTYPALHDAMHIELDVNTSFAAGTTTFTVSTGDLTDVQVGWQIASVSIGGTNISTITAKTSTTFTIATPTAFGGPASFWVYPFGVASFGIGFVNFKLPDYRDRFPMGAGGTRKLGDQGGAETHTLTTAEMPSHTHGVGTLAATDAGHWHNAVTPDGTLTGSSHSHSNGSLTVGLEYTSTTTTGGTAIRVTDIDNQTGGAGTNATANIAGSTGSATPSVSGHTATSTASISMSGSTASAGSGGAHSILNPLEAIYFIIYTG